MTYFVHGLDGVRSFSLPLVSQRVSHSVSQTGETGERWKKPPLKAHADDDHDDDGDQHTLSSA